MRNEKVDTIIIRPSIVGPAAQEPFEGWAGNKPSTLVAAAPFDFSNLRFWHFRFSILTFSIFDFDIDFGCLQHQTPKSTTTITTTTTTTTLVGLIADRA